VNRVPGSRISLRCALVLAGLTLLVVGGCGGSSTGSGIDVPGLERELETVTRLEKIGQGYEADITASCVGTAEDDLHFSCRVDEVRGGVVVNSWTEDVDCRPDGDGTGQRCISGRGYALQ
jgi:hypothetical protein